jgi:hypothetical protein
MKHPLRFGFVIVLLLTLVACTPAPSSTEGSSSSGASSLFAFSVPSDVSSAQSSVTPGAAFTITRPLQMPESEDVFVYEPYLQDSITLSGSSIAKVEKIVVSYTPEFGDERDSDVYALKGYKPGSTTWQYNIGPATKNARNGLNDYVIRGYDAAGKPIVEKRLIIRFGPYEGMASSKSLSNLGVDWHTPVKATVLDLYRKNTDAARFIHAYEVNAMYDDTTFCTMGGAESGMAVEKPLSGTATEKKLGEEVVYDVGIVQSGEYAGATVYVRHWKSGSCMRENESLEHFLQRSDGTFARLQQSISAVTKHMPWDGKSGVSARPSEIPLAGSDAAALEPRNGYNCSVFTFYDSASERTSLAITTGDSRVFKGKDGCFEVLREDGYLEEYSLTLPQNGKIAITWNDGKTTTEEYTSAQQGGCWYKHGCYLVSDIAESKLQLAGKTNGGLEVYQEKLSAADLEAMKTSTGQPTSYEDGVLSIRELYEFLPRYPGASVSTPQEFVAQHPAIYIKDPIGRFLYFRAQKYGPQVECGKPVIYLYPEKTQDISVQVKPAGGLTVSDPAYGTDGWTVRATPQSELLNYADGKTYPYLFWEGHGAGYTRPSRGFVVAKADVPNLLKEKLALLGLNEKESADFREFWEPKLMEKPYVFVTFLEQEKFDEIAPLTVTPAPDSVIRVFMDYEPLEYPIRVQPLSIETPKRSGFAVVEWGGALHPANAPACAPVILR